MLQRNVDGVAVMTFGIEEELVQKLVEHGFPLVFVDAGPDAAQHSRAEGELRRGNSRGGAAPGRARPSAHCIHLAARCACAPPSRGATHFASRWPSWDCRCPSHVVVEGNHTMEGGKAAMEQLLALAELPTAVVCSNDMTAIGVLHALDETTHKVPKDISVVGFDDIHLAQFMLPPLTTVQMSCRDLAAAAVEALRAGIEADHPLAAQKEWPIATRLVVRRSTDFPRGTLPALGKAAASRRRSATAV